MYDNYLNRVNLNNHFNEMILLKSNILSVSKIYFRFCNGIYHSFALSESKGMSILLKMFL